MPSQVVPKYLLTYSTLVSICNFQGVKCRSYVIQANAYNMQDAIAASCYRGTTTLPSADAASINTYHASR